MILAHGISLRSWPHWCEPLAMPKVESKAELTGSGQIGSENRNGQEGAGQDSFQRCTSRVRLPPSKLCLLPPSYRPFTFQLINCVPMEVRENLGRAGSLLSPTSH